jgi:DNA recombination protein RmuC
MVIHGQSDLMGKTCQASLWPQRSPAAALDSEPDLSGQAVDCGVAIATPTTLMIAPRTAASICKVEQRNETAALIANRAGALYNKFVSFVESLNEIGLRLDQAKAAFDIGKSRLSSGRGNLVWQVEELKTLGDCTGKALPANLLLSEDREDQPTVMSTLEEGADAA